MKKLSMATLAVVAVLSLSACAGISQSQNCCNMKCCSGKMNCCNDGTGCCCCKGNVKDGEGCPPRH